MKKYAETRQTFEKLKHRIKDVLEEKRPASAVFTEASWFPFNVHRYK